MVYEICLYISKPDVIIILYKIPVYFQFHKFWIITLKFLSLLCECNRSSYCLKDMLVDVE